MPPIDNNTSYCVEYQIIFRSIHFPHVYIWVSRVDGRSYSGPTEWTDHLDSLPRLNEQFN